MIVLGRHIERETNLGSTSVSLDYGLIGAIAARQNRGSHATVACCCFLLVGFKVGVGWLTTLQVLQKWCLAHLALDVNIRRVGNVSKRGGRS